MIINCLEFSYNCCLTHIYILQKGREWGKKKPKERKKKLLFFIGSEGKGFNSLEKTASFALHHLKAKIQDVPFRIPTRASFSAAAPQKNTNNIDF